jgi:hypothetical protein
MTGEEPTSEEGAPLQSPTAPCEAPKGRPPKVIWRFAPEDQSRRQHLLWLLFEQDLEQEQTKIGSERHAPDTRKEATPRAASMTVNHHTGPSHVHQAKAI